MKICSQQQDDQPKHQPNTFGKAFALGIGLNLVYIVIELLYGFWSNSTALIADAGHNASDVLGLFLAWIAFWLAGRKISKKYSYGYKKSTILISLLKLTKM